MIITMENYCQKNKNSIIYINQKSYSFNDSMKNNIILGKNMMMNLSKHQLV